MSQVQPCSYLDIWIVLTFETLLETLLEIVR